MPRSVRPWTPLRLNTTPSRPKETLMGRFSRSLQLAKASASVLKGEKELVLLPVFSMIATVATAATFLVPVYFSRSQTVTTTLDGVNHSSASISPIGYVLLFLMYVAL